MSPCESLSQVNTFKSSKHLKGAQGCKRPSYLCSDEALSEDVFVHAYTVIQERNPNEVIDIIVILMCNSPTVTSKVISQGIDTLRNNPAYDSVVTASRYNMWSPIRARKIGKDGLLYPCASFECFEDIKAFTYFSGSNRTPHIISRSCDNRIVSRIASQCINAL